jgi:maltoporin
MKHLRSTRLALAAALVAAPLAAVSPIASAQDSDAPSQFDATEAQAKKMLDTLGIRLWGYARGGFYGADGGRPKGKYAINELGYYRLGNEGDNYLEFGIGKTWRLGNGLQWGTWYMPKVYNGESATAQVYTDLTGLDFAPGLTLWAGQRYHRVQDIHIIDDWLMEDGDNYGAGVDGVKIGSGKLNVALYTSDSTDRHGHYPNNAKRLNLQLRDLAVNPGGTLTLTAGAIRGDFAQGSNGGAIGALHNQKDFIVAGLTNSLFVQASRGHAALTGKFYNLDDASGARPGAKQARIVDSINWQIGAFGGQALVGYQTLAPSDGGAKTKDFSVGGRLSYGLGRHTKLYGEGAYTQRRVDGQDTQNLKKGTLAVAFAPDTKFWTRPELRIYASHMNWNDAAAAANAGSFGAGGRTKGTTVGVQAEAWWE